MKVLNMQQLCSFAQDAQKIEDKFVLLKGNDAALLQKFRLIGCRVVMLVFSGRLDVEINGKPVTMERCDFLDILEGTSFGILDYSQDLDFYCIPMSREFIMEVMENIVAGPKDYFSMMLANPVLRLSANATSKLFKQIRIIDDVLSEMDHNYRTEMVRTHFKGFVLELANLLMKEKHLTALQGHTVVKKDTLMANFMELVWKHFRERRNISFYADKMHLSPQHLSTTIKKTTGRTLTDIISAFVIKDAQAKLRSTELTIQEIAYSLNFPDISFFGKYFKRYTGVSPKQYRNMR